MDWKAFAGSIHQAQFKQIPNGFKALSAGEITQAREKPDSSPWLPRQEKGIRPACALPYELSVDGSLSADRKSFAIRFAAAKELAGEAATGAPFHVYAPGSAQADRKDAGRAWAYAINAGDLLDDSWPLKDFADGIYHLRVHGPNGFFREFRGTADDPALEIVAEPVRTDGLPTGDLVLRLVNRDKQRPLSVSLEDLAYGGEKRTVTVGAAGAKDDHVSLIIELRRSHGWHDLRIGVQGAPSFERRYAGHVETGRDSFSDPFMGRALA